jgi:hypothetical protein
MSNALEKWREADAALDAERRLMNEALSRLNRTENPTALSRPPGRLIFGLDLTGSRQPSLKRARVATAAMFEAIRKIGRVWIKLVYYRGAECKESEWHENPGTLCKSMLKLSCECGWTQIARLLQIALAEKEGLSGIVFIGDHCEEYADVLVGLAQSLGKRSAPLFIFHECTDTDQDALGAKPVFKRMAEVSGGTYVEFRPDSGDVLRELLSNIAAFSAAGIAGVEQIALPQTAAGKELRGRLMLSAGSNEKRKT